MIDLEGRVIAIAGAGGGLGPTVARTLADAGATLALSDVDTGRLDSLVEQLALADDRCDARVADLLGDDGAREWANALEERFGRTDALLHLLRLGGEDERQAPLALASAISSADVNVRSGHAACWRDRPRGPSGPGPSSRVARAGGPKPRG